MPGRSQALIRLGRLAGREGEPDEAKDCADQLALYAPDNPNAIALFAEIDAARGDHASAVRRRKEAAEKFPQLPHLWHEYGVALIAAHDFAQCEALVAQLKNSDPQGAIRLEGLLLAAKFPEAGHSAFWKQAHEAFPQNATFLRRHVLAALRDGKKDEAALALETLFASQLLREGDTNYVIGMVNLLDDDRGRDMRAGARFPETVSRHAGLSPHRVAPEPDRFPVFSETGSPLPGDGEDARHAAAHARRSGRGAIRRENDRSARQLSKTRCSTPTSRGRKPPTSFRRCARACATRCRPRSSGSAMRRAMR